MSNDSGRTADELRERIRVGQLVPGTRMPTLSQLSEEFGVPLSAVRAALKRLHDEGLLTSVPRGSPARAAAPAAGVPGDDEQPRPALVGLAPRLLEAFSVPDVRIDAVCLSVDLLMLALAEPLRAIHAGQILASSVRVRVLLPSSGIPPASSVHVEPRTGEDPVHEQWPAQRSAQRLVLLHNLPALRPVLGIDAAVSFRAVPFTPPVKRYVLNGTEALFGYCTVTGREEEIGGEPLGLYDVLGTHSMLYSFAHGAGSRDEAFVTESQRWFDGLWGAVAADLALTVD
ncbi:GntR family transcriptional regulator [Streptomyces sp. ISL-1]|uniref:winged helix-turn-helix domain-containing protein n=1 Tax=Streptomyces sp. ISL-1 TaxID=2817657 RepID=UPI001BE846F1|nr:winged helix-turn-helix domain-containing protein [Streptomyces sp. ISL-1]MBT2391259.1 GntR family transcriptional regulator [Streptomyces sp. ISL-1]